MDNIIYYLHPQALGDEIHMYRNILLTLLEKKYITNDIVVYCLEDRRFLYSNIFNNVICYENVANLEEIKLKCDKKFNKNFIILNSFDICFTIWEIWKQIDKYGRLDVDITITKPNIFNFEKVNFFNHQNHSVEFRNLVKNI